ncbi:MAG: hypothetical protein GY854_07595 [Deltaproteobacteria bacterium]|nr:hypothetical protein [Deltaproteobacteria bacterium]
MSSNGQSELLCKQCAGFLRIGLEALVKKVAASKKTFIAGDIKGAEVSTSYRTPKQEKKRPPAQAKKKSKPGVAKRPASATERDLFSHRSLSVTRYIDGFINGLESVGLDRNLLAPEASQAINTLLAICQKLTSERLHVCSGRLSRSDVRRLTRHIGETEMMVEEYVRAVSEACQH